MRLTCCRMAGLVLASGAAFAQSNAGAMLRPVTGSVRDAGVYHLGLGTWTRHVDTPNLPVFPIYANTCPTGYYVGQLEHEYAGDEGRVPGVNGPVLCDSLLFSTNKGCACGYEIDAFQIGYCTGLPHPVDFRVGFQSAYVACDVPAATHSFTLTGLPGAGAIAQGCWLVTVDLQATHQYFQLAADGASCTWGSGDSATNHLFGWTFENLNAVTGVGSSYAGPLIASNGGAQAPPSGCSMVDGTRWDTLTCMPQGGGAAKWPNNSTEDGWGMDTQDRFRDDSSVGGPVSAPSGPGCYYFGSFPQASFHLRLFTNLCTCADCAGFDFCRPIEDNLTCPCNNQPTTPGAGCNALTNPGPTLTGGAFMRSTGNAIPYDVGTDTVHITVAGLPTAANESSMLLQGTTIISALTFGQGLRCCGGPLKRMTPPHVSPGTGTSFWPNHPAQDFFATISERSNNPPGPQVHILPGQTYCYFIQYRQSLFFPPCALPANFNASQVQTIVWHL